MKYSNEQLLKIEEKAKKNKKHLTHITGKSKLSTEDKLKLGLCAHFVQHIVTKRKKLKEVAKMIGLPVPRLSEITNYKINKFTVDQLLKNISLLAEHDAQVREYLKLLEKAAEMPALSVSKTKKLTRDLSAAAQL